MAEIAEVNSDQYVNSFSTIRYGLYFDQFF